MEGESYWTQVETQGLKEFFAPGKVTEKPPTNTEYLRLYNNPICPFAERARIALALRGFEFQIVQIDNNDKPPYFVEWGGTVPILEKTDGTVLNDSKDIIAFAIAEGKGPSLVASDEKQREEDDNLVKDLFDGYVPTYFQALGSQAEDLTLKLLERYQKFEDNLANNEVGNAYFNNSKKVSLFDVLLQGFISRTFHAFEEGVLREGIFDKEKFPNVVKYVKTIEEHPVIAKLQAPKIPTLNHTLNGVKAKKYIQLPYPVDYTPIKDSQGLKKLYVLDGNTAKPRTNDNYIRLYGHPGCPFVERATLALAAKGIEYQFVGLDLTVKNKWHLDINNGFIPILELPSGEFVTDSLVIADWVQNKTEEGLNLYPGDEANQKLIKDFIKENDELLTKITVSFVKYDKITGDGPQDYLDSLAAINAELEKSSTGYLLSQEHETLADLVAFPHIHRALLLKNSVIKSEYYEQLDFEKLSKLKTWYEGLKEKYAGVINKAVDFEHQVQKRVEAAGPKVQLHYPIPSEQTD